MADEPTAERDDERTSPTATLRSAARSDWRAAFMLSQMARAERELDRLRRLTTDDARS